MKPLGDAKVRLSAALSPDARRELVVEMFEHVLGELAEAEHVLETLVVSRDPDVRLLAERYGCRIVDEEIDEIIDEEKQPKPLDEQALNHAIRLGIAVAAARGARACLVLPADLPAVEAVDIDDLCACLSSEEQRRQVAIAPDGAENGGTNALLLAPPTVIEPSFGLHSANRHVELAERAGAEVTISRLGGFALDIDTPADYQSWDRLQRRKPRGFVERPNGATSMSHSYLENRLTRLVDGERLDHQEALDLARVEDLEPLFEAANQLCFDGHQNVVSYSRKVFLPLTHLCRDICHYCIFAQPPKKGEAAYMTPEQVLDQAKMAATAGCKEALFTLGDKPELRYKAARQGLAELGHETTLSYLREVAQLVFEETGLLPHLNPGLMDEADFEALRPVSASMGIMLESVSERLMAKGQAHYGCPDKLPSRRLETLRLAGVAKVPFTSGILIGIGETREERIEALLALRDLNDRYGHIQEIIVQNFRAKEGTRMVDASEPTLGELLHTLAIARLVFGKDMNVQAPPNLSPGVLPRLVAAGINDWGGVSPVTPDFVNPEAPWPHLGQLAEETARAGKVLTERLTIYPDWARDPEQWLAPTMRTAVLERIDTEGFAKTSDWAPGEDVAPPEETLRLIEGPGQTSTRSPDIERILDRAQAGQDLSEAEIVRLFKARGDDLHTVCRAADEVRRAVNGDQVTYVVNRNINYTNICYFKCQFCAFSKGKLSENLRGKPYDLGLDEIARRTLEAWDRGATEVCMQGGIHPDYTGETYINICRAVKEVCPGMHVHAFSPLEVWQGAATLGIPLRDFLIQLKVSGLGTLPGTAAEILDDEVRAVLCADKIRTDQWLEVMRTAHEVGFNTTATIMYGHIERPEHWARHLLRLRDLQKETGGFTEFVPLPFVHMEAPIFLKGQARSGPTFREAILVHAVARLALHPHFNNIQASWVKMGPAGVAACLESGANDLGGTLMNESITRAAGSEHGQEMPPDRMEALIEKLGRVPKQRSTAYGEVPRERIEASFSAGPLTDPIQTPAKKYERSQPLQLVRPGFERPELGGTGD